MLGVSTTQRHIHTPGPQSNATTCESRVRYVLNVGGNWQKLKSALTGPFSLWPFSLPFNHHV